MHLSRHDTFELNSAVFFSKLLRNKNINYHNRKWDKLRKPLASSSSKPPFIILWRWLKEIDVNVPEKSSKTCQTKISSTLMCERRHQSSKMKVTYPVPIRDSKTLRPITWLLHTSFSPPNKAAFLLMAIIVHVNHTASTLHHLLHSTLLSQHCNICSLKIKCFHINLAEAAFP